MTASTRYLLLSFLGLGLLAGIPRPAPPQQRLPLQLLEPTRSCKPSAPLRVELVAGVAGGGERVALGARIEPLLEFEQVEYALLLPSGARVLDGRLAGTADPRRGRTTAADALLQLPDDLAGYGELRLVVTGTFTDRSGTPQRVEVERSLTWGELPEAAPVRRHHGAPDRADVDVHVLPTTHRRGR